MCGFGDRHLGQCIFQIVTAIAVLERISDSELEELERSQADFVLSGELDNSHVTVRRKILAFLPVRRLVLAWQYCRPS